MAYVRTKWFITVLEKDGLYARVANAHGCSLLVYLDGTVLEQGSLRPANPYAYSDGFINRVRYMGRKAISKALLEN